MVKATINGAGKAKKRPGRKAGALKYDDKILLRIINAHLPSGSDEWEVVAAAYSEASRELLYQISELNLCIACETIQNRYKVLAVLLDQDYAVYLS